ncbi:MAG: polysaccharide deacetylase family protein [Halodesulfurarchaeum sp.]|nr:polysaccharide deacetylase family protein [Halodesulfurarchaeum sp.]
MSLGTRDQEYMDRTELEAALEYAEIAAEYDVPVTLFVTGKAAKEEPERVERLAAKENVEIGGHNYWAFDTLLHKASRGLLGSWNGPRSFQRWEINRTIEAFASHGVEITSWRDHAYRHDDNTASLLFELGITHFSDAVGPDEDFRKEDELMVLPINTPPDHEHVYHGFRTEDFVSEQSFDGPFGSESYDVDQWLDWVLEAIEDALEAGQPATVLAHPACMDIVDDLATFEELCAQISEKDYEVHLASEVKLEV